MSELEEALDRTATHLRELFQVPPGHRHESNDYLVGQALLAICDALVEIAAVLPAPYTVPKE